MKTFLPTLALAALALTASCGSETDESAPAPKAGAEPAGLFVDSTPDGARPVAELRAAAAVGEEVVLQGRIGGRSKPFVGAQAMFVVVDTGLKACSDDECDDCPTPWDYCCSPAEEIAAHSATVQVVGDDGEVLAQGLEGVHGLRPLAHVVVQGKVRSTDGGLLVDAERIHVVPD